MPRVVDQVVAESDGAVRAPARTSVTDHRRQAPGAFESKDLSRSDRDLCQRVCGKLTPDPVRRKPHPKAGRAWK